MNLTELELRAALKRAYEQVGAIQHDLDKAIAENKDLQMEIGHDRSHIKDLVAKNEALAEKNENLRKLLGATSLMRNGCPWCGSDTQNYDTLLTRQSHYVDCPWSLAMEPNALGRRYRQPVVMEAE